MFGCSPLLMGASLSTMRKGTAVAMGQAASKTTKAPDSFIVNSKS